MGVLRGITRVAGRAAGKLHAGDDALAWHKVAERAPKTLEVTCPLFTDGGQLPLVATVDGAGVAVPVQWSSVPDATQSLVVLVEDPDAPLPEPFVHWLVYGIPRDQQAVRQGASFVEGKNTAMHVGFAPAAPPPGHGVHHYHFQVFALDTPITLEVGAGRSAVLDAMDGHVIAWGDLVGTYQRP